jgi:NADPH:quinone reductase-like Zn-dependent oxidoreductase
MVQPFMCRIVRFSYLLKTAKRYVFDRLADGRFVAKIAKTYAFAKTVEAYRYLESNQQVGKVVITVP